MVTVYDPQWTPPELSKIPVVVFRFEDVRLVEWYEDQEGRDRVTASPDAPPGQVGQFDWEGTDKFTLDTFMLRLVFHAPRAAVTVCRKQNEFPSRLPYAEDHHAYVLWRC
ncbi:hypothetical protein AB0G15_34915 [Streptosporangium sp. NPDC023825]|uniref:hypothetical protein n=1 Tax=Streptosporangium sp. NPDC023825 TaxID=3154909 RepID=UPI0034153FEE